MEQPLHTPTDSKNVTSLAAALRTARVEGVERSQVVAELRGAEIARLEMLKDAIAPVLAQVPPGIDLFDAGIVPGEHPRLFVDMIGFVEMARDRRTYLFVQDTRHGRVTMAQSDKLDVMEQAVTHYIARRLVERERALASDMLPSPAMAKIAAPAEPPKTNPSTQRTDSAKTLRLAPRRRVLGSVMRFVVDFLGIFTLGMLLVAAVLALVYFGFPTARMWIMARWGWVPF